MSHSILRLLGGFAAAMLLAVGLSGCNTVAGAGEDLQSAGEAVEDTAEKKKAY